MGKGSLYRTHAIRTPHSQETCLCNSHRPHCAAQCVLHPQSLLPSPMRVWFSNFSLSFLRALLSVSISTAGDHPSQSFDMARGELSVLGPTQICDPLPSLSETLLPSSLLAPTNKSLPSASTGQPCVCCRRNLLQTTHGIPHTQLLQLASLLG